MTGKVRRAQSDVIYLLRNFSRAKRERRNRYNAVGITVLSLEGRVAKLTTFVLPELFAAWGFPPVLDA
ncbi:hypothetical protein AKJ09_06707 [Labilithrix luteola]|uniref:Uncharacterized protein n=1 Tax=Labilithrix luteola TaxID=1391654 RepID=A0A0K1Q2P9_9BACT|nr:hypothetical protein [Labilithrix luteola]AKV00044.1 hypothetical protein AKJ09_06707 [Labilithrix luteola]